MGPRASFPLQLEGPLVWSGRTATLDYVSRLDPQNIKDIEKAVSHFKGLRAALLSYYCHHLTLPSCSFKPTTGINFEVKFSVACELIGKAPTD